jgi:hypothetical protein
MSAECSRCGTDLVYGTEDEWPDMHCPVCVERDEVERLAGVIAKLGPAYSKAHQEIERLRAEHGPGKCFQFDKHYGGDVFFPEGEA